jgi:putative inorganic carbon (hco3(-)) transporter
MINQFLSKRLFYLLVLIFIIVNSILIYFNFYYLLLLPLLLIIGFLYIFHLDIIFLIIVFCTPLSFNFENLDLAGIGFYFPTEPMLLIFSGLFIFNSIYQKKYNTEIQFYKNPIVILIILQLIWILTSSITSELTEVSFKFFISRSWFIIPMIFYGFHFFKRGKKAIYQFFLTFLTSMLIVTTYTLINHMINGFSEEAGHWVMWPFFKDHTSYGAVLAFCIPINIWMIYISENKLLKNLLYFGLIIFFVGLYFSYTRAAWLSILIAGVVFLLYQLKIKFKWIIGVVVIPLIFVLINFTEISYLVQKNDAEHTTENFSERVESMSNISSDASNLERLNRWSCALELFYKRPFFGWGPGTYSFVYAPFQSSKNLTIISTNFGDGGNAHSEYLGPLAEQGFIGFLINLILIAIIFISSGVYYIKCDNLYYKNLTLMVILALVTYFSHGILNNYLDTDKAAIPVWGLISIFITISTALNRSIKRT